MCSAPDTILVALCSSSSVLTAVLEVIRQDCEGDETLPDQLTVISTAHEMSDFPSDFFETSSWWQLRGRLAIPDFKLMPDVGGLGLLEMGQSHVADVASTSKVETIANSLLKLIGRLSVDPERRLLVIRAEDRGEMCAASVLAMSLIGRAGDRLQHLSGVADASCPPRLEEIPFVKLRSFLESHRLRLNGTYADLVEMANLLLCPEAADFPELTLRPESGQCVIGDVEISLSPVEFALFWLLALNRKSAQPPFRGIDTLTEEFVAFTASISCSVMPTAAELVGEILDPELVAEVASSLSDKINSAAKGNSKSIILCMPIRGEDAFGIALDPGHINCPKNY